MDAEETSTYVYALGLTLKSPQCKRILFSIQPRKEWSATYEPESVEYSDVQSYANFKEDFCLIPLITIVNASTASTAS